MLIRSVTALVLLSVLAVSATAQEVPPATVCVNHTCADVPADATVGDEEGEPAPQEDGPTPQEETRESTDTPPAPQGETVVETETEEAPPAKTRSETDGWMSDALQSLPPYIEYILGAVLAGSVAIQAALTPGSSLLLKAGRRIAVLGVLPFLFLFSRIRSNQVLDQPVRARLMQLIQDNPGMDVDELSASTDVAWSTARHHLRHLENHGMVRSARSGQSRRYFAAGTPASRNRHHLAALEGASRRRVAKVVLEHPGTTNGDIADRLGLSRPSVTHHLRPLLDAGLVTAQKDGRTHLLTPTPRLGELMGRRSVSGPRDRPLVLMRPAPMAATA